MKNRNLSLLICSSLLSFAATTHAADYNDDARQVRAVLSGGLTYGGDTLEKVDYNTGDSVSIRAGNLVQVGGGMLIQPTDAIFAVQLTANYQWDGASARNGTASFQRFPLEATLFYTAIPNWRVGLGVRYVTGAKISGLENIGGQNAHFRDTTGGLAEIGYAPTNHLWISARYVVERYKLDSPYGDYTNGISANHFGMFATGVF